LGGRKIQQQRAQLLKDLLQLNKYGINCPSKNSSANPIFRDVETLAEAYATCWTTQLTTKVSELLPRELRNLIYEQILDAAKTTACMESPILIHAYSRGPFRDRFTALLPELITQYGNEAFFCSTFRREIAQTFYFRTSFMVQNFDDLRSLMYVDVFNAYCAPVASIRKLWWRPTYIPSVIEFKENLRQLKYLGTPRGFELTVACDNDEDTQTRMHELQRRLSTVSEGLWGHGILVSWESFEYSSERRRSCRQWRPFSF
jgi:hypothetical protein